MTSQLDLWPESSVGPHLRWSISRDKRFKDCRRKYYYYHHASCSDVELGILKQLHNRFSWVGEIVHELVQMTLEAWRRGHAVSKDEILRRGVRQMRAQYAQSVQRLYREKPRQALGLMEHEYQMPIEKDEWLKLRQRLERCIENFFGLSLVQKIQDTPISQWLLVENLSSFAFEGATVVVKPDFVFRDSDQSIVLVDWKTGQPRPDSEDLQIAVYALLARHYRWDSPGPLRGMLAYLETGTVSEVLITGDVLKHAESAIRESTSQMRTLVNRSLEYFPMVEDTAYCTYCNFRRLCGRT